MQYYGNKLSENISRREPEGYLLCLNVPVARSGTQEYLPEELGIPPGSFSLPPGGLIPVMRPEEEVFAPETVASFEGMPVTNDHPADGVDLENIRRVQMGHAHNVRRGIGDESDLLLADLIITDGRLIEAILNGKREISCGYTYELSEENGQFVQRKIRGNHIAVVDAGRAGARVSIKDHKSERSNKFMKKSLTKLLARMAKDGDVETVAEFIEEMIGEETGSEGAAGAAETVAEAVAEAVTENVQETAGAEPVVVEAPEAKEITIDEETFAGLIERLDRLIALLTPAAADSDEDELDPDSLGSEEMEEFEEIIEEVLEADEEEIPTGTEEEVAEMIESILEPTVSTTLEETEDEDEECGDPEENEALDERRRVLAALRPALAQLPREKRKRACRDMANRYCRAKKRKHRNLDALAAKRSRADRNGTELGKRIMAARNPNYRKR